MEIEHLLRTAAEKLASDVHLCANTPPVFRVHGELVPDGGLLDPSDTEKFAQSLMSYGQWESFLKRGELDFSFTVSGLARFRVNVYRQQGCVSLAIRLIDNEVPTLAKLALPGVLRTFTTLREGLILVTGPTGSGKSTTLAALIHEINCTRRCHIITLEDPIEYLHKHKLSIIEQREIGLDTKDFSTALRAALRQDPDVILVGELRDLETMRIALTAAETGHLVLATLHTGDAVQTVDRVIDVFPAGQQTQIRIQLADVLQGVIAQRLFMTSTGDGQVAAVEVLVNTPPVANLIRTANTHQIKSVMQTGRNSGMQTMEMAIEDFIHKGWLHS